MEIDPFSVKDPLGGRSSCQRGRKEAEAEDVTNLLGFRADLEGLASGPPGVRPRAAPCSQGQLLQVADCSLITYTCPVDVAHQVLYSFPWGLEVSDTCPCSSEACW